MRMTEICKYAHACNPIFNYNWYCANEKYILNSRLVKAFADLKTTLETEQDLKENEDYITAQQVLKDAEPQLPENAAL